MEAAMAEMQKSLASMPPAQRKQMEQMMAQQGWGWGHGPERQGLRHQGAGRSRQHSPAGGLHTAGAACGCQHHEGGVQLQGANGEPPSSGEGTVTFQGPKAYSGQFKFKTVQQGKPEQIDMAQKGRWLSDDCGAIKPMPTGR